MSEYVRDRRVLTLLTTQERVKLEEIANKQERSLSSLVRLAVLDLLRREGEA